jgi:hypothetical protein
VGEKNKEWNKKKGNPGFKKNFIDYITNSFYLFVESNSQGKQEKKVEIVSGKLEASQMNH